VHRRPVALLGLLLACGSDPNDAPTQGCSACGPGLTCESNQCKTPARFLVTSQGGPVVAAMQVWTVVWTGDESVGAQVDTFNKRVLASSYYTDSMSEYGVGAGTAHGVIVLGAPPIAVDDAFYDTTMGQLIGKTSTSGETFGTLGANTVVTFVIPISTIEPIGTSYHTETGVTFPATGGAITIPYIVLRQDPVGFVSDFDYLTWTQSHELTETASDPHPSKDEGWLNSDLDVLGEIADLCNDTRVKLSLGGMTYTLTRVYSAAKAAARLGDPCVPALSIPYENVEMSPLDLTVPKGLNKTATLHLHAYSLGATTAVHWSIYSFDPSYTLTPSSGTIVPGGDIAVVVKRTGTTTQNPTALNLWVTDTATPNATIPNAESFSALTVGN